METSEKAQSIIYNFFIKSHDNNGIPLSTLAERLSISYLEGIETVKKLVEQDFAVIEMKPNPYINCFPNKSISSQITILEDAKNNHVEKIEIGDNKNYIRVDSHLLCIYPPISYLNKHRDVSNLQMYPYSKELALGHAQLQPIFFDIDVLERYSKDPRYRFTFHDYSGSIYCEYDEQNQTNLRESDEIFLKSFGVGLDEQNYRVAVVYRRYLGKLTAENQQFWKSKEHLGKCLMVGEYHENTILGEFTNSHSIFSAFLGEHKLINEMSKEIAGVSLFNKTFDAGNRPQDFSVFFVPTLENYERFILILDKILADNINKKFFTKVELETHDYITGDDGIKERREKGTIRLLEEWISTNYTPPNDPSVKPISEIFQSFKKVRKERQNPAHRINKNNFDKIYFKKQIDIIVESFDSLKILRHILQCHPNAKDVHVPEWLEHGDIKIF